MCTDSAICHNSLPLVFMVMWNCDVNISIIVVEITKILVSVLKYIRFGRDRLILIPDQTNLPPSLIARV